MTTYILHGGNTSKDMPSNREFFSHFTESVPEKKVDILLCYWASTKDTWKDKFEEDKKSIRLYNKKQFNTQIVTDPDDLKQKIANCQVIYFRGGRLHPQAYFDGLSSLKTLLIGKVYIGSSMGAYLASTQYMASSRISESLEVKNGLGLLPLSIVCHWDINNMKRRQRSKMLKAHSPHLSILTLNEGEFVTIIH